MSSHPVATLFAVLAALAATVAITYTLTAEPLRDRIDSQRDQIEELNSQLQRCESIRQSSGVPPPRSGDNQPLNNTPVTNSTPRQAQAVLLQEYEGFRIEVTSARLIGAAITFDMSIINTNASDARLFVAGNDGGNYGFLGFYSNMFVGGERYIASEAHVAGEGGSRASVIVPGEGQTVRASIKFEGVPSSAETIERLNVRVSTGDAYPSQNLAFGPITIER